MPTAREIEVAEEYAAQRARKRELILETAILEAQESGWQWMTRDAVAKRAGVAAGSIQFTFGTMVELKREVMREAVRRGILPLIASGLAEGSPIAQGASPELKQKAISQLA